MEFIQNKVQLSTSKIQYLSSKFNLHTEVVKLLLSRGLDTEQKIAEFLSPSINKLHNPFLLKNMTEVVKKINNAIDSNLSIVILGDYDTDGISASAILYKYFTSRGAHVNVFLPNRFIDGYGLNNDTIDKLITLYNPQLIVTVDCGISSYKEVDYCKSKGVDIIVTDHHDIPEIIPDTLVIDPKLEDQQYPFKELCGAGVALKLVQAMAGLTEALKYTTIASLATVADIVPLVDENRTIVHHGLNNQEQNLPIGIKKLCKKTKITLPLTAQDIAYKLAPKINASGRMGDATISYKLYVCDKDKDITNYINQLLKLNDDRLENTSTIADDAFRMLEKINVTELGMIVLCKRDWESGVLGIICAKLVEKYHKPVCLLTQVDDEFKGSCRSIPGINIYEVLAQVQDILIRFGGHNQAGGLSLKEEYIDEFTTRVNDFVLSKYSKDVFVPVKTYDIDANKVKVDYDFLAQLDRLEPFGFGNERPTFKLSSNTCNVMRLPNHPQHLKVKIDDVEIMCFSSGDLYYNLMSNSRKDFLLDICVETFGNSRKIVGKLKALNYSKLNGAIRKEVICANYLHQLTYLNTKSNEGNNVITVDKATMVEKIKDLVTASPTGTLVIANTFSDYESISKLIPSIKNFELYQINHTVGENTLLLAPNSELNIDNYSNIILLNAPLTMGYVTKLAEKGRTVYVVDNKFDLSIFKNLDTARHIFGIYHNIIKDYCAKNLTNVDLPNVFKSIKKLNPQNSYLTYDQFYFVTQVLNELSILNVEGGNITYNKDVSSKLTNSTIYNFVNLLLKINKD